MRRWRHWGGRRARIGIALRRLRVSGGNRDGEGRGVEGGEIGGEGIYLSCFFFFFGGGLGSASGVFELRR